MISVTFIYKCIVTT